MNQYHKDGENALPFHVFVFGSNLTGDHRGGAALHAVAHYRAELGAGSGHTGSAYALPTMIAIGQPMSLLEIGESVQKFLQCARKHPERRYYVTRVGCGIAANRDCDVAPLFRGAPDNCNFPENWRQYLEGYSGPVSAQHSAQLLLDPSSGCIKSMWIPGVTAAHAGFDPNLLSIPAAVTIQYVLPREREIV
jgi:hypothetical protein